MENRKGSKIIKILDDSTIMFEDNWISENDKIIYNQNDESFTVLVFTEYLKNRDIGIGKQKHSCVKLNKSVNVGDVLYTHLQTNRQLKEERLKKLKKINKKIKNNLVN